MEAAGGVVVLCMAGTQERIYFLTFLRRQGSNQGARPFYAFVQPTFEINDLTEGGRGFTKGGDGDLRRGR